MLTYFSLSSVMTGATLDMEDMADGLRRGVGLFLLNFEPCSFLENQSYIYVEGHRGPNWRFDVILRPIHGWLFWHRDLDKHERGISKPQS
jgi:hypothetical protein